MIPVILAGGKGERFWPLSRRIRPKQFLSLDGTGQSLLQSTAERLLPLSKDWEGLWVITSALLENGVRQQLPNMPPENILAEPQGRDTAPAVAWTVIEVVRRYGEDTVIGFFPADHWIGKPDIFREAIKSAENLAISQDLIVTLGLQPQYPATGYGYIEQGEKIGTFGDFTAYQVARFTEKPNQERAEQFLATGRFSWNAGIFIFRAGVVLQELRTYVPDLIATLEAEGVQAYANIQKISIDYALMEKTQKACVLPVSFGWDDLGDWNSLERLLPKQNGNVALARHLGLDTQDCIIYGSGGDQEVIVTIGVQDLVIVRDGNVTLIVDKNRTQDIKKILPQLEDDPNLRELL